MHLPDHLLTRVPNMTQVSATWTNERTHERTHEEDLKDGFASFNLASSQYHGML